MSRPNGAEAPRIAEKKACEHITSLHVHEHTANEHDDSCRANSGFDHLPFGRRQVTEGLRQSYWMVLQEQRKICEALGGLRGKLPHEDTPVLRRHEPDMYRSSKSPVAESC